MSLTPENLNGLDALANAIVTKAVDDYRKAYMLFLKGKKTSDLDQLRHFFRSQWCAALTNLNTEALMAEIEKECKEKFERKHKHANKNQVHQGHNAD